MRFRFNRPILFFFLRVNPVRGSEVRGSELFSGGLPGANMSIEMNMVIESRTVCNEEEFSQLVSDDANFWREHPQFASSSGRSALNPLNQLLRSIYEGQITLVPVEGTENDQPARIPWENENNRPASVMAENTSETPRAMAQALQAERNLAALISQTGVQESYNEVRQSDRMVNASRLINGTFQATARSTAQTPPATPPVQEEEEDNESWA